MIRIIKFASTSLAVIGFICFLVFLPFGMLARVVCVIQKVIFGHGQQKKACEPFLGNRFVVFRPTNQVVGGCSFGKNIFDRLTVPKMFEWEE